MAICDSATSMLTLLKVYLDFSIGIRVCESTAYDWFWEEIDHSCGFNYYGFPDVFNYQYSHVSYAMYPYSCTAGHNEHYITNPAAFRSVTAEASGDHDY